MRSTSVKALRVRLLGPPHFRPSNDSLPAAVPAPGAHARGQQGLVSGWVAEMKIEVFVEEVFL